MRSFAPVSGNTNPIGLPYHLAECHAPMPHASLQLVISRDNAESLTWPLDINQTCLIGRGQVATLRIDDPFISRAHCQIEAFPTKLTPSEGRTSGPGFRWVMSDLDSTTGTIVNGDRVPRVELHPGDQIVIGRTRIQVAALEEAAPPQARPAAAAGQSQPVAVPASVAGAGDSENRLDDLIGKKIHDFCLERVLARGAHGTVFLARDIIRDRDVALKILTPEEGDDDDRRRRFTAEMRHFRVVKHRNLVRLIGAGRMGPYCWLAMEYIDGQNLKQVIASIGVEGMFDWSASFQVALDIARGLEVAEANQVVHGNITPKSILLRSSDRVVKLAGLMVARTWTDTPQAISTRIEPGAELAYLSPERLHSKTNPDHRSDIYGLGASVYGLLTGRPPYDATSLPQMLNCLEREQPPSPSQFQPLVPEMFEKAVMRMIAKSPESRYKSATELVHDLERIGKSAGMAEP